MSAQAFEIRCPSCGALVPPDAKGCSCATAASRKRHVVGATPAGTNSAPALPAPEPVAAEVPDIVNMRMKDYHRLVRSNYVAVEGPRLGVNPGFRARNYLPFVLLLLGLIIGAGLVFDKF